MQLCCPKGGEFTAATCHWQGKPGSCYDNVCAFDTEIQLANSYDGDGENCGIQLSRDSEHLTISTISEVGSV